MIIPIIFQDPLLKIKQTRQKQKQNQALSAEPEKFSKTIPLL
jgi:hypothetical protein